jgi:hypothetical protein
MMRPMFRLACFLAPFLFTLAAVADDRGCVVPSAKLLILGTYHMDNPGLDAVNVEADDVLAPRRQAELAELAASLARFAPTKIAVEAPYSDRRSLNARYARYLAGDHTLSRNEIEQIGFRLAKMLGHTAIHPIDYPMMMSGLRYDELDFAARRPAAPASPSDAAVEVPKPRQLTEDELRLRRVTITENLRRANDPEQFERNHAGYFVNFLPDEDPVVLYSGADRMTNWYKRNFRMFSNLVRVTDLENDRVLLIVGSGHLQILRDLARHAPYFCLEEPAGYLQ